MESYLPSFFPELEKRIPTRKQQPRSTKTGVPVAKPTKVKAPVNPCIGCNREHAIKVMPSFVERPLLQVVGMAPGKVEEEQGEPFVGPAGDLLRSALAGAGIDPATQVNYANLGRCRPENDDFESKAWHGAEKRCWSYLSVDLARTKIPLLVLGTRPLMRLMANTKAKVSIHRGLWIKTADGRNAFVARHPSSILRAVGTGSSGQVRANDVQDRLEVQFRTDIKRMADRLLKREPPSDIKVTTFETPGAAREFLARLAKRTLPWAFDIEAFDAVEYPSRLGVATDPCHPDFRLRGIAFAWSPVYGAYVEMTSWENFKSQARELLDPVFGSPAIKRAFNGGYDEDGLVYPGWVTRVNNRAEDAMLGLVALGDSRHESLRLEKAAIDVLKKSQSWDGGDKGRMRDLPLKQVATGAVGDACRTFDLCEVLNKRLIAGEYL